MGVRIMAIAALWGTTIEYSYYGQGNSVVIETSDGRVAVIKQETFDALYVRLNDFLAALKEDCIEYVVYEYNKCMFAYPEWYADAVYDGLLFEDECTPLILYSESGDIAIAPGSMILRNFKGDLQHLEAYQFYKYYDTIQEWK